jgi:hypothetical protein
MKRSSHRHRQGSDRLGRNSWRSLSMMPTNAVVRVSLDRGWALAANVDSQAKVESEFRAQADQWRRDTLHTSSLTKMILHPSYLRIIGMGRSALPFLFQELAERPDHWLVALNAITGQDPAATGSTFDEAVTAWLDWGRRHSYLR